MEAGHRMELVEAIRKAKDKFDLSSEAKVVSCYEAGRDGFWLHRYLVTLGVCVQLGSLSRDSEPRL
jgi:transposase